MERSRHAFFHASLGANANDKSMGTVEISSCKELDGLFSRILGPRTHGCVLLLILIQLRLFAVGSADSLVSLWSMDDLICGTHLIV